MRVASLLPLLLGCGAATAAPVVEPSEVAPLDAHVTEGRGEPVATVEATPALDVHNPPAILWSVLHRAPNGAEQFFNLQQSGVLEPFAEWRCHVGRQQSSTRVTLSPSGQRVVARDMRTLICGRPGQTETVEVQCGYDSAGDSAALPVNESAVALQTSGGVHRVTLHCELAP